MNEILFTPAAVFDLLQNIDELSEYDLEIIQVSTGKIQLRVGESLYNIDTSSATSVNVDKSVVFDVKAINDSEYESAVDASYTADMVSVDDEITSGVFKEVAKTLLVGGLVRLTSKLLRK